jgi:DNA polymerase-3 subunit delta
MRSRSASALSTRLVPSKLSSKTSTETASDDRSLAVSAAKRNTKRRVTPQEVRRSLTSEPPAKYYLFHGEESYRREQLYRWATEHLRPDIAADFNVDVFHGDNVDCERLLDLYNSYPMMAPHRLVLLRDADRLSGPACKALEPIIETPSETTVFVATGGKLDMRRKLFSHMSRQGVAVEFKVPFDNKLPDLIQEMAAERQLLLAPEAVDRLRLYVGTQLAEMANELEKLAIYIGDREEGHVTAQDVEELVGVSRGASVFEFTDAVGRGDRPHAVELLHSLLGQGEEPHRIIPLLTRHLQLLLRTQQLEGHRLARDEMARSLGVAPFFLDNYRQQARSASTPTLWRGLLALRRADDLLKSGGGRARYRAVMDLCLSALTPRRT